MQAPALVRLVGVERQRAQVTPVAAHVPDPEQLGVRALVEHAAQLGERLDAETADTPAVRAFAVTERDLPDRADPGDQAAEEAEHDRGGDHGDRDGQHALFPARAGRFPRPPAPMPVAAVHGQ